MKDGILANLLLNLRLFGHRLNLVWWHNILSDRGGFLRLLGSTFSLHEISPLLIKVFELNMNHLQLRMSEAVCLSFNQAHDCI